MDIMTLGLAAAVFYLISQNKGSTNQQTQQQAQAALTQPGSFNLLQQGTGLGAGLSAADQFRLAQLSSQHMANYNNPNYVPPSGTDFATNLSAIATHGGTIINTAKDIFSIFKKKDSGVGNVPGKIPPLYDKKTDTWIVFDPQDVKEIKKLKRNL